MDLYPILYPLYIYLMESVAIIRGFKMTLQWRHNETNGFLNHRRLNCLLNRLFRHRLKKHQSPASLAFVRGIHRWPVNSPHKRLVMRKMFPFDDVIIMWQWIHNAVTNKEHRSNIELTIKNPNPPRLEGSGWIHCLLRVFKRQSSEL